MFGGDIARCQSVHECICMFSNGLPDPSPLVPLHLIVTLVSSHSFPFFPLISCLLPTKTRVLGYLPCVNLA